MRAFPPFGLRIETERLILRLPDDAEVDDLAARAAGAILAPEQAHFLGSWTQLPSPEFELSFCQFQWRSRAELGAERWRLPFAVFRRDGDRALGIMDLFAAAFSLTRTCTTGSWLLPEARGEGIGREMRAAVLALAFDGLGADRVRSIAHPDNAASRRVSAALGYREDGTQEFAENGSPRPFVRYLLHAADHRRPAGIDLFGVDACRALLGADGPSVAG